MSRSSSGGSVINGSECSFDDNAIDDNDFESLGQNEFVSSGASTPIITDSLDVAVINQTSNIINYSEDEMETPVPNSSDKLIDSHTLNNINNNQKDSPFDFTGRNGFGLAQISEDVEHETIINTPNTAITAESKVTEMTELTEINSFDIEDVSDTSDEEEDDEPA